MTLSPPWDNVSQYLPERPTVRLLRLVSATLLEPPRVDVGDAAIFWLKPEEER